MTTPEHNTTTDYTMIIVIIVAICIVLIIVSVFMSIGSSSSSQKDNTNKKLEVAKNEQIKNEETKNEEIKNENIMKNSSQGPTHTDDQIFEMAQQNVYNTSKSDFGSNISQKQVTTSNI